MDANRMGYTAADSLSQARGLSTSISSLSSSASGRSGTASHISKTYRQASTLFLTRRLPEALSTVLPLVSPPQSDGQDGSTEPAPVIRASRSSRIKVWSLYLTVLNAIAELDSDDGKDAFGAREWRALCYKVRSGEIWEEVVRNGYHGVEGDVDAEVAINLATLLLAHAKNQTLNQKRLENYLAAARTPNLEISADHFSQSPRRHHQHRSPSKSHSRHRGPGPSGADTPRDLEARVKILELYTLHVLPRNGEWEYAREFIGVSPVLDDERREAFLQALDTLREEQAEAERRAAEERAKREEAIRRDVEEARRLRAENEARERRRLEEERAKREEVEKEKEKEKERERERERERNKNKATEGDFGLEDESLSPAVSSTSSTPSALKKSRPSPGSRSSAGSAARRGGPLPRRGVAGSGGSAVASPTLMSRATRVLGNLRVLVDEIATAFQTNPYVLMRMLAFVIGLLLLLSRKRVRERMARIIGVSWNKVKATVGMGTKVSYI
ncbi:hypothetical protein C7999DRAFT_10112 [Corynascus novoguineensis]|uniref:Peroxin 26 n=1 Tax=Corynascus novoguineensis TaxID=1126955 RepID=A0AAN7HPH9_9PEZI|nr:hypothetical protein C7999DRAFT_10112 [Corynascus novoguineensis]